MRILKLIILAILFFPSLKSIQKKDSGIKKTFKIELPDKVKKNLLKSKTEKKHKPYKVKRKKIKKRKKPAKKVKTKKTKKRVPISQSITPSPEIVPVPMLPKQVTPTQIDTQTTITEQATTETPTSIKEDIAITKEIVDTSDQIDSNEKEVTAVTPEEKFNLAVNYFYGEEGVKKDYSKALNLLNELIDNKLVTDQKTLNDIYFILGKIYLTDNYKDLNKSSNYFKQITTQNQDQYSEAQQNILDIAIEYAKNNNIEKANEIFNYLKQIPLVSQAIYEIRAKNQLAIYEYIYNLGSPKEKENEFFSSKYFDYYDLAAYLNINDKNFSKNVLDENNLFTFVKILILFGDYNFFLNKKAQARIFYKGALTNPLINSKLNKAILQKVLLRAANISEKNEVQLFKIDKDKAITALEKELNDATPIERSKIYRTIGFLYELKDDKQNARINYEKVTDDNEEIYNNVKEYLSYLT